MEEELGGWQGVSHRPKEMNGMSEMPNLFFPGESDAREGPRSLSQMPNSLGLEVNNQKNRSLITRPQERSLRGRTRQEQRNTRTDTVVSAPSGWKLQETVVSVPVVLVDLNLHVSFPWVPFATKISFGVYTSKADTPVVTGERGIGKLQRGI